MKRTIQEAALTGLIAGVLAKEASQHPLILDVELHGSELVEVKMNDGTPTGMTMQVIVKEKEGE